MKKRAQGEDDQIVSFLFRFFLSSIKPFEWVKLVVHNFPNLRNVQRWKTIKAHDSISESVKKKKKKRSSCMLYDGQSIDIVYFSVRSLSHLFSPLEIHHHIESL